MAKKEQKQLILWAVVALVLGVLIGVLMTNAVTAGKAASALNSKDEAATLEEKEVTDITDITDTVEDRRDLVLNLLKVNRIENRQDNPLIIASTHQINMGSEYSHVNLNDLSIDIGAPQVRFSQLPMIEQPNQVVEYFIGDTFIANTYIVEVMNIWDANGIVEMQLRKEGSPPITHFYGEGDYIIPNSIQVNSIDSNSVYVVFYPSNNAYLCIHQDGSIYRSSESCR